MRLFDRVCSVTVGDVRITDLRMRFSVKRTIFREPNTIELVITNLSAVSRAALQVARVPVTVEAGYQGTSRVLFVGTARRIEHRKTGVDWETKLQSGDGELQLKGARVNTTLAPGASFQDAVRAVASSMGVAMGNLTEKLKGQDLAGAFASFSGGVALHGSAAMQLDRLLDTAGYGWSIQDGVLQLLRDDETTSDEAVLLSPQTGLVGTPEFGEWRTVLARSLLQPDLRPGRRVQMESDAVTGLFRVQAVTHRGDTHGADWYSDVELKRL